MIATDEDALICDLAETYGIYDYKALPATRIALFSVGLRNSSRIKMKLRDTKYTLDTLLMAAIMDRLSILVWSKTKDAAKGIMRPESIVEKLLGEQQKDIVTFNTPEEFEIRRAQILQEGGG